MEQNNATRQLNPKNTIEDYNNNNPSLTWLLFHKQPIKIYHQNIRSLRYKMSELQCHLTHDPTHMLCITEHHLHHEELASFYVEYYVLGSCSCRKSKSKGGVCIFVHNSIKFTSIDIDNYCLDRDFEACAIHLKSKHDKLCTLATYRSPQGNFSTYLTNLDLTLHKFFNQNLNCIVCGDINVDYLMES
jgi:exonuclease III